MSLSDTHLRYAGMSYRQASEEAERLLKRALASGSWFDLPEALIVLRSMMDRRKAGHCPDTDAMARVIVSSEQFDELLAMLDRPAEVAVELRREVANRRWR